MPEVVFHPDAVNDLAEIAAFHREHRTTARRLICQIHRTCENLARYPYMGRSRENFAPGLRSFPVPPYLVFYRLIETGIEVLYVIHGRRDLDAIFAEIESR